MSQPLAQYMEVFTQAVEKINDLLNIAVTYVWSTPMILTLMGVGFLYSISLGFIQLRSLRHSFDILTGKYASEKKPGFLTPFESLTTSLSSTVGLGNISGVAIAISYGGPGAIFWMVIASFIGMATKYAEATLAVKYRKIDDKGIHGGPMHYIIYGLGEKWKPLAVAFAVAAAAASFGGPNMFQTNQAASILHANFNIDTKITGLVFAVLTAVVILGGITRIGRVTSRLVPAMVGLYLLGSLLVVFTNLAEVPKAFALILTHAFTGTAAVGAFQGIAVREILIYGIRRACFSNEAGLGCSAIAHSASSTKEPAREGCVAMLEPFIDSMISLFTTALVILISGVWMESGDGVILTARAFDAAVPGFGQYIVPIAVCLFAFTTVLSWSYYGESSINFLFGKRFVIYYKILFCIAAFVGAVWTLEPIISFSDMLLGLMAIPNLIALIFLSRIVVKETKDYFRRLHAGEFEN